MLQKLFGFNPSKTTIRTEILAGITTFLTMSYILAVNPSMFAELDGMPAGAVFTATALAAISQYPWCYLDWYFGDDADRHSIGCDRVQGSSLCS